MNRLLPSLLIAAVLLGCAEKGPARSEDPPTNLLLVSIDTLRADRIGSYGYPGAQTPVIDELATRGLRFDDVSSVAPITAPAHASLFTGLYPPRHGVRSNGLAPLPSEVETLAERLQGAAWSTGAIIGGFPLKERFGFSQGFDTYDDDLGQDSDAERTADRVSDLALRWLGERKGDQPFFLFLHYFDPHADYRPPDAFQDLAPYDGEIAFVDREIGRVLDHLKEHQLLERTLVALVSDHGESLGEHGEPTHAVFVYQSTLAVPLILSGPGVPRGEVRDTPVSLVDVPATLLERLGVAPLSGDGQPLLTDDVPPTRPLYFESLLPAIEFRWAPLHGLRRGSLKWIAAPRPELYDLDRDPAETQNLGSSAPEATPLANSLKEMQEGWPDRTRVSLEDDPDTRDALESLGYLGGTLPPDDHAGADPKDRVDVIILMAQGLTALREDRPADAVAAYRQALAQDPSNVVTLKNLARSLGRTGDHPGALEHLERALGLADPGVRAELLELAVQSALASGEDARVSDWVSELEALRPGSAAAALARAQLHSRRGDWVAARDLLSRYVGRESEAVLIALAEAELNLQEESAAEAHLRRALKLRDPARAQLALGALLLDRGDSASAIPLLRSAAPRLPARSGARVRLARALLATGDVADATATLEQQLEHWPGDPDALRDLGVLLSRQGATDRARELLGRAVEEAPGDAEVWNALGAAQGRAGDYSAAVESFSRAVELHPDRSDFEENLATARSALGEGAPPNRDDL